MKKFLALLLVLGMTSLAGATIIIDDTKSIYVTGTHNDVNQNGVIDESDIIDVTIVSNVDMLWAYDFDLHVTGPGTLSETDNGPGYYWSETVDFYGMTLTIHHTPNRQDNGAGGNGLWLYSGISNNCITQMSDSYNSTDPCVGFSSGDLVWGLAIHCTGEGDVVVDLTQGPGSTAVGPHGDNLGNSDYGDMTIKQIPEPATLSLLGLGAAMWLRRRRR